MFQACAVACREKLTSSPSVLPPPPSHASPHPYLHHVREIDDNATNQEEPSAPYPLLYGAVQVLAAHMQHSAPCLIKIVRRGLVAGRGVRSAGWMGVPLERQRQST